MNSRKFHIICILLMMWNFSLSQHIVNYNINDGLPSNHVYKIVQDTKGFIWMITDNGMVKYNGTEFKVFSTRDGLPTNDIWEIATTADGKVWFFCKALKIGYIENDRVHSFDAEKEGTVFFPQEIFENGNLVFFYSNANWYFLNDKNKWETITNTNHNAHSQKTNAKFAKIKDSSNRFVLHYRTKDSLAYWLTNDHYYVANINTGAITGHSKSWDMDMPFSRFPRINSFNGQLQIADDHFLAILDAKFRPAELIEIPKGFQSHYAFKDRSGNLWIATFKRGVFKIPKSYRNLNYALESESISSIDLVDNNIVATVFNKGYYKFNTTTKNFVPLIENRTNAYPPNVIPELNAVLYLDQSIVLEQKLDSKNTVLKKTQLEGGVRQFVYYDSSLWGYRSFGLSKISYPKYKFIQNYPFIGINCLLPYKDRLLMGTTTGIHFYFNDQIQKANLNSTLFSKPILKLIAIDKDWVLVCTDGFGAYVTDLVEVVPLDNTEHLNIYDAYVQDGELGLATNMGVYMYSVNGNKLEFKDKFMGSYGLSTRRINGILANKDTIFIGTDNGMVYFNKNIEMTSQPLDVYADAFQYNGEKVSTHNPEVVYTKGNSMDIKIQTIDYSEKYEPDPFRYKLLPTQKDWTKTTSKTINFSHLPPNDYTLLIGSSGIEKQYTFKVLPLWWQKTMFKIGVSAFGSIALLSLFFWYKNHDLKKKTSKLTIQKTIIEHELKALRSQMNPHFVFNALAAIQYYINDNNFEASEQYLLKFSKLIRQFFELSEKSEISLNEELELLKNFLQIEQFRFKEKLSYTFKIDSKLDLGNTKIPTMLLQPIVENAVNHGIFNKEEAGHICIDFSKITDRTFKVDITDDGVGKKNTKKSGKKKMRSSDVLKNRLHFLNESKQWHIEYSETEMNPANEDVGNISKFVITKLN